VPDEKKVVWIGTSLDDLRDFPKDARHDAGFQLEQVQLGLEPDDWKPMPAIGAGVGKSGSGPPMEPFGCFT